MSTGALRKNSLVMGERWVEPDPVEDERKSFEEVDLTEMKKTEEKENYWPVQEKVATTKHRIPLKRKEEGDSDSSPFVLGERIEKLEYFSEELQKSELTSTLSDDENLLGLSTDIRLLFNSFVLIFNSLNQ
jgi:hypothetical protein